MKNISILYRPHPWGGGGNRGNEILNHNWKHVKIESYSKKYLKSLRNKGYHMTFPDYSDTHIVLSHVDFVISPLSTILIEAALLIKTFKGFFLHLVCTLSSIL